MTSRFLAGITGRRELLLADGEALGRAGLGEKIYQELNMGCGELPVSHPSGFVKWLIRYQVQSRVQERKFRNKCRNPWCRYI